MSTLIAAATLIDVADTPSDSSSAATGYIRSSSAKIMAIACTALILFIVLMVFVLAHIYSKYLFIRRRQRQGLLWLVSPSQPRQANPKVGLHKSLLDLLPTFVYTSHSSCSKERLECAVCLSDFQEQEQGRRLPQCGHIFHTACIDKWFSSNSTCPLCRIEVKEELVGAAAGTAVSFPSPTLSVGSSPVCLTVSHSSERRLESSEEEATGVAASCFDGIIHASAEKPEKTADHPALPQLNQTLQPESFHCPVNSQATATQCLLPQQIA
ncbi:hypothetical protein O6H91_13G071500 [Diphasiastrum complanatum]|uniref:Uncharacterized protein n=1 Tax=Diphasiastrum complanatum TaxID=34168 RepID=A0ACC2BVV5_DIPCM|nr:hypothetical protein O6H91_13G071500 [Diphasiastrum complanatum]